MRHLTLLIILLNLTACGDHLCDGGEKISDFIPNFDTSLVKSDQELLTYLERVEKELGIKNSIDVIRFITDDEEVDVLQTLTGICIPDRSMILLRKKRWMYGDDDFKYGLLLHEIGHCYFKKPHSNSTKCDNKIMHTYTDCSRQAFKNVGFKGAKDELQN